MYEKITPQNVVMYAIKNYDNPQCEGEKEFEDDLKRFKYIKRLLRRYYDTGVLKERLLLNHLIVLNNVFSMEAATTLLLYKIQPTYWPALKSFLIFLNSISDNDLTEIEHDKLYYTHQLPNPSGINYQSFVESQLEIICYKCDNGYPVANKFQARTCPDGWTTDKNPCKITGDPSSPTNPNIGARMTNPNTPTTPSTSTGPAAPTGPTAPSPGGGGY